MFGRVTALHFPVFFPSTGEIVNLTATVSTDANGDLIPGEVYVAGSGEEIPALEVTRAGEHAMDACADLQDCLWTNPVGAALRGVVAAEQAAYEAAQWALTTCADAKVSRSLVSILEEHKRPGFAGHTPTPGERALEDYVAHLAETYIPKHMKQKAEEAQERHHEQTLLDRAEDAKWEAAECAADLRADGIPHPF